jgi:hypothetical protein
MAVMTEQDRFDCWAELMRSISGTVAISKQDLRAAVDALDAWLSDNATAINNALPAAAKAGLTVPQKAVLLNMVVAKRYLTGA